MAEITLGLRKLPGERATRRGANEPSLNLAGNELSRLKKSLLSASLARGQGKYRCFNHCLNYNRPFVSIYFKKNYRFIPS